MRTRLAAAAACVAALPGLVGCGGDDEGGGDGPATLVPRDAALYAQLDVRPEGELRATATQTLRRITGRRDVGAAIAALLDEELREEDPALSFEDDVEPWLGDRVALFFEDLDDFDGAFVIEARDTEDAERFARETAEGETTAEIVEDFLVLGDERAVENAIETAEGDSLADEDAYSEALDAVPEDSLGHLFLSLDAVAREAPSELEADTTAFFDAALRGVEGEGLVASVSPRGDAVEFELSSDALAGLDGAEAAELVASLPGEAWGVAGIPDAHDALRAVLRGLEAGTDELLETEQALGLFGISVEGDLIGPIEAVAGFVTSGLEPIGAAAVITSRDPEATREVVETLGALLQRTGDARPATVAGRRAFSLEASEIGPEPVYVVPSEDGVVLGYGRAAAERALADADPLSGVAEFRRAAGRLGADPVAYIAVPEALRVGQAFGLLSDPGAAEALPYLERARYAAIAVEGEEDRGAFKVLIGLQR